MTVSNHISRFRRKLQHSEFLSYSYIIFLTGFFISPDNHLHRNYFYIFVLLPFLLYLDLSAIRSCMKSNLFKLGILFLLYFLISMVWTGADLSSEKYYDHIRYFLMLVLFIMATMLISANSSQFSEKIILWLCFVALAAAIGFILIFYASHNFPSARVSGPFDYTKNPNQAAMHFGFVGILSFYSIFSSKGGLNKILYWSVFGAMIIYILLSQSRNALLAIICSILLGLIFEKRWKTIGIVIILCVGFIIIVETIDIGIMSFIERGFSYRIDLWLGALKRISQVPIFGEGYFTDVNMHVSGMIYSPHNLLLLVMVKSGILGGGFLLILILTTLVYCVIYFRSSGNWMYLCLFVYFIVCMTFDSAHLLYKPSLAWLIFWLPVALMAGEEIRLKTVANRG